MPKPLRLNAVEARRLAQKTKPLSTLGSGQKRRPRAISGQARAIPRAKVRSPGQVALAAQLKSAAIWFEAEVSFAPNRKYRADFVIPYWLPALEWRLYRAASGWLIVEVDGYRRAWTSELEKTWVRDGAAIALGYTVLHCSTAQAENGMALKIIKRALGMA